MKPMMPKHHAEMTAAKKPVVKKKRKAKTSKEDREQSAYLTKFAKGS